MSEHAKAWQVSPEMDAGITTSMEPCNGMGHLEIQSSPWPRRNTQNDRPATTTTSLPSLKRRRVSLGADDTDDTNESCLHSKRIKTSLTTALAPELRFPTAEPPIPGVAEHPSIFTITPSPSMLSVKAHDSHWAPSTLNPSQSFTRSIEEEVGLDLETLLRDTMPVSHLVKDSHVRRGDIAFAQNETPTVYIERPSLLETAGTLLSTSRASNVHTLEGVQLRNNSRTIPLHLKRDLMVLRKQLSKARRFVPPVSNNLPQPQHCSQSITGDWQRLVRSFWKGQGTADGFNTSTSSRAYAKGGWHRMSFVFHDLMLLGSIVLLAFLVVQGMDIHAQWKARINFTNDECIYVTGGGFSGFWFSLGRLHSLSRSEMTKQRFACYSAGCLGVVAVYANHSMPELYRMASSLQRNWKQGDLNRYHVVQDFVDQLLDGQSFEPHELQSLHILTSVPQSWGVRAVMRQPTSMEHLGLMLRQSAWIPLATGSEYTLDGHLDGGFSVVQHPTCQRHVGLANDWSLLTNTLNVNLGEAHVQEFWRMGLEYGI